MSAILGHSHPGIVETVGRSIATLDNLFDGMLSERQRLRFPSAASILAAPQAMAQSDASDLPRSRRLAAGPARRSRSSRCARCAGAEGKRRPSRVRRKRSSGASQLPCDGCEAQGAYPNINYYLGDANYSSGTFALHDGVNVITGTFIGVITEGNVNLIAEDAPETSTWVMMALGFAGLSFASYRSRARTALGA